MSTKIDTTSGLAAPVAAGKTFDAVLAELVQPFDPESVEFKAGATTQDKARALALAYVDARVYQARLDAAADLLPTRLDLTLTDLSPGMVEAACARAAAAGPDWTVRGRVPVCRAR